MKDQKNEEVMTNIPPTQPPSQPPSQTPVELPKIEAPEKNKPAKNKMIKIGIIVGCCLVAVAGLVFLIAGIISNNTKLATPTGLEVVETPNGDIYVSVKKCSGAVRYRFDIENADTNKKYSVNPTTNVWDVTESMGTPAKYKITCQYVGKTLKNTSNYCETIEYTITKQIAKPQVWLGEYNNHNVLFVKTENRFSDNDVYVCPSLIYNVVVVDNDGQKTTACEIADNESLVQFENPGNGYYYGYYNLDNIFKIKGTQYQLSVQVSATGEQKDLYKTSVISSQVFYKVE